MAEIKVNINSLKNSIEQLKNLKQECMDYENLSPNTVGGGLTITELENITKIYDELDSHFIQLVNNTILFMNNVKTSYETSDKKAASNISNK